MVSVSVMTVMTLLSITVTIMAIVAFLVVITTVLVLIWCLFFNHLVFLNVASSCY